jgi:CRP-like cAMP-binding protein
MITIERVAFLRAIDLFADIPDAILAAVAGIVDEVPLEAGETFIHEGEFGDCMYLVVDGQVRVHRQGRTIINLGPGQPVGELAVLDPEPRAADVSAQTGCLLFRIAREPFEEVMADRPEIARGVIRALCQRVRAQGRLATSPAEAAA